MFRNAIAIVLLLSGLLSAVPLYADEGANRDEDTIVTFWPLFDYRSSPKDEFRSLSLLGPLFTFQHYKRDRDIALRPLFYSTILGGKEKSVETTYLYPVARSDFSPDTTRVEVLQLFQHDDFHKEEGAKQEKGTMLFPFYISGTSDKYGPYTSVFPFYGNIYERFWKDEYHFVLFPIYGKTVKKGTTNRNYFYPFFSTTEGPKESGFQFWPLYGEAAKEGVYSRRFVLWPFYMREKTGLDTENPVSKRYFMPFYAAVDSPQMTTRYYMWPFFGHRMDLGKKEEEWDYFWPFWKKIRGAQRNTDSYLPFYSHEERLQSSKTWYMWPLYKHESDRSGIYSEDRDRVLFFLYSNTREIWPKDGRRGQRTTFWPLFVYNQDPDGVKALGVPAPVEPIFNRDGIEKDWAPLWRIYQQKWKENGDSTVSFLWNLYWHEVKGDRLSYELFPFIAYRSDKGSADLKFLKGLIHYRDRKGKKELSLLWLPFGLTWGKPEIVAEGKIGPGSKP